MEEADAEELQQLREEEFASQVAQELDVSWDDLPSPDMSVAEPASPPPPPPPVRAMGDANQSGSGDSSDDDDAVVFQ